MLEPLAGWSNLSPEIQAFLLGMGSNFAAQLCTALGAKVIGWLGKPEIEKRLAGCYQTAAANLLVDLMNEGWAATRLPALSRELHSKDVQDAIARMVRGGVSPLEAGLGNCFRAGVVNEGETPASDAEVDKFIQQTIVARFLPELYSLLSRAIRDPDAALLDILQRHGLEGQTATLKQWHNELLEAIEELRRQLTASHYPALKDYFKDYKAYIRADTRWFAGRDFVFKAVDDFMRRNPCGYFRIVADAGLGKTAIAVELTRRYEASNHFFSAAGGVASSRDALNNISAQLIARFELDHDHLPQSAGDDATFLCSLLEEVTRRRPGRPVVIVIDALDEADAVPAGHNWAHLPQWLPPHAYIITTQRPGDYPLSTGAGTPIEQMAIAWDDSNQQKDIESHLRRQAERKEICGALAGSSPPIAVDRFVAALKEASEGNFMYLHYVLEDVADRKAGFDPLHLESLPRGLPGYYDLFWARIGKPMEDNWPEWSRLYRPVIELLAIAREPVTVGWLAAHTGLDQQEISGRPLRQWRRLLSPDQRSSPETWRVVHSSFRDFLRQGRELDLRAAHRRVAEHYLAGASRWQEYGGYALRHLGAHISSCEMWQELSDLVERQEWFQAQRAYDPALRTYASDVERAIALAEQHGLDGLPRLIGMSLLYGYLRSRASQVPVEALETMVLLGETDQALRYADLIAGAHQQVDAYRRIGACLLAQGQASQPLEALNKALATTEGITDALERSEALAAIAEDMAQAGQTDRAHQVLIKALAATEGIAYAGERSRALESIAQALAQSGQTDQASDVLKAALAAAEGVTDKYWRSEALVAVARGMARAGQTDQAREVLNKALAATEDITNSYRNSYRRSNALAAVAHGMAQAGQTDQARKVLNTALAATEGITYASERSWALAAIAQALAQAGQRDQAREVLKRAVATGEGSVDSYRRSRTLTDIAQTLAQAGQTDQAHEVLRRAVAAGEGSTDSYRRSRTLAVIAQTWARAGQTDQAREVLNKALAAAEGIIHQDWRSEALAAVAQALAQAGQTDQAREVLDTALAAAERITDAEERSDALADIHRAMAEAGQTADSQATRLIQLTFRHARRSGRDEAWEFITRFAPALGALGIADDVWTHLQKVEALWGR